MIEGHLEVFCCDLDRLSIPGDEIAASLSPDELRRAERFRFPELARRYLTGRYMLRRVLAAKTGCRARDVRFALGDRGKPRMPGGPAFNLSDSRSLVLIGLAAGGNLGVDVEHVVASRDLDGISHRYFSTEERSELERLPDAARVRGFYRVWTRKEALIKALGLGLSLPLESFVVSAAEDYGNSLLRGNGTFEPESWLVQSIVVGHDCEAAFAWDRRPSSMEIRHFPEIV
jgi:4'-phosphopantetheinyl transferase